MTSNIENGFKGVIEWCFNEDFIKLKTEIDKPSANLIPIRTNEQVKNQIAKLLFLNYSLTNIFYDLKLKDDRLF